LCAASRPLVNHVKPQPKTGCEETEAPLLEMAAVVERREAAMPL